MCVCVCMPNMYYIHNIKKSICHFYVLIIQVFDDKYFLVEMDDLRSEDHTRRSFVCHANSPGIFPVQWSLKNGLHINPPPGTHLSSSMLFLKIIIIIINYVGSLYVAECVLRLTV